MPNAAFSRRSWFAVAVVPMIPIPRYLVGQFVLLMGSFVFVLGTAAEPQPGAEQPSNRATAAQRHNFLVIVVDDQGYADLGAYEHAAPDVDTPNMAQSRSRCSARPALQSRRRPRRSGQPLPSASRNRRTHAKTAREDSRCKILNPPNHCSVTHFYPIFLSNHSSFRGPDQKISQI